MNLSREDASAALESIEVADRRVREMVRYRAASPFLILWGLIWLLANVVLDVAPDVGSWLWPVASISGGLVSAFLGWRQMRCRTTQMQLSPSTLTLVHRRMLLLLVSIAVYFPAMFAVLGPLGPRRSGAFISLFWAFAYMVAGAWLGTRLFVTGAVTAIAILTGYLFIQHHFPLWLGVVGGGSLLLGGFWLRKT